VFDIVLELGQLIVVNFVGGLENGMGAAHFGRFVLVGGRSSIVEGSAAVLEAFLVSEDEVTRNPLAQESGPLARVECWLEQAQCSC
jgi:hypothetical protein